MTHLLMPGQQVGWAGHASVVSRSYSVSTNLQDGTGRGVLSPSLVCIGTCVSTPYFLARSEFTVAPMLTKKTLLVYELPDGQCHLSFSCPQLMHSLANFNHTVRSWLVIWKAEIVIELPPWVLLLYPSSLLYHFNIDVDGLSPGFSSHLLIAAFQKLSSW